jgi:acetyltransferase-like isoleucine patch superfamily enzyme
VKQVTSSAVALIDPTAQIARSTVIGSPFRPLLDGRRVAADRATTIGAGVWIGEFCSIGQGVSIGDNSILEEYVGIQNGSALGQGVLVTGRSWLGMGVTVGDGSVIKGHVGDATRIGAGCRIAGDLIHRQLDPTIAWDDPAGEEPSPMVEDGAFVGWRAVVIGGVNIGAGAYVCAGALVTKDVPAGHIAYGRNQVVHPGTWEGALGKSPFFQEAPGLPSPFVG